MLVWLWVQLSILSINYFISIYVIYVIFTCRPVCNLLHVKLWMGYRCGIMGNFFVFPACQMSTDVGNPWGLWNLYRNILRSQGRFWLAIAAAWWSYGIWAPVTLSSSSWASRYLIYRETSVCTGVFLLTDTFHNYFFYACTMKNVFKLCYGVLSWSMQFGLIVFCVCCVSAAAGEPGVGTLRKLACQLS